MPPKSKKFWQFKAKEEDPDIGELMLYGDISSYSWRGDDITPKQFKEDLDALGDITQLNVYINSGGGDVFAGQAIRSMLKRHRAYKTGYVEGLAASIASVVLTGCDKVVMPVNAMQMIHMCRTFTWGNADDMRKMAEDMDKIDESIIAAYMEKTGLDRETIVEMMKAETWMTAEEALENGFADEIEHAKEVAASLRDGKLFMNGQEMDLSRFTNAPKFTGAKRPVRGEGRTLSAANEQKLGQARDLINEVLEQSTTKEDKVAVVPALIPDPAVTRQAPVDIYQKQIQINRRKANV